ncbi:MAG: hypothetical protein EZS28_008840 [Streblomastix strix]|uniref:Uncharacterized protein n=1 Tax=Streblomastix strix TaxID=222440 RepID=A0A5J4WL12_9EUKA|nr:MAG: hypothetical protein EZS28_008840 [Streblomastix strix]
MQNQPKLIHSSFLLFLYGTYESIVKIKCLKEEEELRIKEIEKAKVINLSFEKVKEDWRQKKGFYLQFDYSFHSMFIVEIIIYQLLQIVMLIMIGMMQNECVIVRMDFKIAIIRIYEIIMIRDYNEDEAQIDSYVSGSEELIDGEEDKEEEEG